LPLGSIHASAHILLVLTEPASLRANPVTDIDASPSFDAS